MGKCFRLAPRHKSCFYSHCCSLIFNSSQSKGGLDSTDWGVKSLFQLLVSFCVLLDVTQKTLLPAKTFITVFAKVFRLFHVVNFCVWFHDFFSSCFIQAGVTFNERFVIHCIVRASETYVFEGDPFQLFWSCRKSGWNWYRTASAGRLKASYFATILKTV